MASAGLANRIGVRSATLLVVANVIGAGVFTTTGFQAADLGHPVVILLLWALGGVLAWCGALCYAELGAMLPEAGGEYVYLRTAFGRSVAFMSAFVSLVAGFSAPIAAAVKSLVAYLDAWLAPGAAGVPVVAGLTAGELAAVGCAWALVAVHLRGRHGYGFNDVVTVVKLAGIVGLILGAAFAGHGDTAHLVEHSPRFAAFGTGELLAGMATSLIFVMYCYSGWNAAAYVAGEIDEPGRALPRALLLGTGIVAILYVALNAVYFYAADVDALAGRVEVGLVAARALFGEAGAAVVTPVLVVSLLASASAMTLAGPRVYYQLGHDVRGLQALARTNPAGAPAAALVLQGVVTTALIVSGRVDQILSYAGFTLALMSSLAVICVIVLRIRRPELARPFRVPLFPGPPLLFLAISVWTMAWAVRGRPVESLLAFATVAAGAGLFAVLGRPQTLRP